jgi:hypothetical protein
MNYQHGESQQRRYDVFWMVKRRSMCFSIWLAIEGNTPASNGGELPEQARRTEPLDEPLFLNGDGNGGLAVVGSANRSGPGARVGIEWIGTERPPD